MCKRGVSVKASALIGVVLLWESHENPTQALWWRGGGIEKHWGGVNPHSPVLHSPWQGTIRPARLPLLLHGDL